jgi:hypothetical protein
MSDSCLARVSVELLPLDRMTCVVFLGGFDSNDCSDSSVLFIFFETKLVKRFNSAIDEACLEEIHLLNNLASVG